MPDHVLAFHSDPVDVVESDEPLRLTGRGASEMRDEIGRLIRFETAARKWYINLLNVMSPREFFSLPKFPND